jgi:hypothetical protein
MRVLMLKRDPSDQRTGVFTSGIVSVGEGRKIALYFTGSRHAGENIAEVLKQRSAELPSPIQMCDALSRNVPKLPAGVEILLANCLAHGRRRFVEVAENFPSECRYMLEMLGQVYLHDAEARQSSLTPEQRLRLHQDRSRPSDGQTARVAGGAVSRAKNGAELRAGPGDRISASALEALDLVPPPSRRPAGWITIWSRGH